MIDSEDIRDSAPDESACTGRKVRVWIVGIAKTRRAIAEKIECLPAANMSQQRERTELVSIEVH